MTEDDKASAALVKIRQAIQTLGPQLLGRKYPGAMLTGLLAIILREVSNGLGETPPSADETT